MTQSPEPANLGLPYRAEPVKPVDATDLEEFHERHSRDAVWVRVALVGLGFALVALNLWIGLKSYEALTADVDASRFAQAELHERTMLRLEAIDQHLAALESRLPPAAPPQP